MRGSFRNIDLYRLVTEQFPHHMISGTGTLHVQNMKFADGRLAECQGRLVVEKGIIGRSLLEASSHFLNWELDGNQISEDRVAFRAMDFFFTLRGSQLKVAGNGENGVIMWHEQSPLARYNGPAIPIVNVIRVLVPQSLHQVPATRQTATLISILPVPDLVAEQSSSRPTSPPVRLGSLPDGIKP
jgi:hypothetical protein